MGEALRMHGKTSEPRPLRRPTVFFMPSAEGDASNYVRFRAELAEAMDFKVIDYPGWRELIDGGSSFDVIVNAAVQQILAEPDCSPYFLAGYSFGGFVAWEAASRLAELNQPVRFVGLIDTRRQEATRTVETRSQWLKRKWQDLRERPRSVLEALRWQLAYPLFLKVCPKLLLREIGALAFRTNFTSGFGSRLLIRTRLSAMGSSSSTPLDVPAYLFRSEEFVPEAKDFNLGRLCSNLHVVPVTGTHLTLFQSPNFENLTGAFREAVLAAQSARERL